MFNKLLIKNKNFTLIELIVVIGILAILTSLIMPNIKGVESEAKGVALATDRKAIQTAIDMYNIDHVEPPILADETTGEVAEIEIGEPGVISMDKLYPEYLRDFPSSTGAKYWLDYTGKVWVSLADAPVVTNNNGTLSWEAVDGAVEYIVYEYSEASSKIKYNLTEVARVTEPGYIGEPEKKYMVQSVDNKNNRSVLVRSGYAGYPDKTIAGKEDEDEEVIAGDPFNEISWGENLIALKDGSKLTILKDDPNGSGVMYDFANGENSNILINNEITDVLIADGVENIGAYAFKQNNLSTVKISDTVTKIGASAFSANNLVNISIGSGVTEIGSFAIYNNNLETVTLPQNLIKIGYGAFQSNNLTEIVIPDSVEMIDRDAFEYNYLVSIEIGENVSLYAANETMGENGSFTTYYDYNGKVASKYEYKHGQWNVLLEDIDWGANLTASTSENVLTISKTDPLFNSVMRDFSLNGQGFLLTNGDTIIDKVVIDDGVETIGANAFYRRQLKTINISDTVTKIGDGAFNGNELVNISIGNGVTEIGKFAFYNNNLEAVTLSQNLVKIGYGAFQNNNLTEIIIPDSVEIIDRDAFENNNLTSIEIGENVSLYSTYQTMGTHGNFTTYYDSINKISGIYLWNGSQWSMVQ